MTFDWSEYLKLAQELAGDDTTSANEEAKLRSSISRAYYAAFCKARNYLRDVENQNIPRSGQAHTYVCGKFADSYDRTRAKIGTNLKRLKQYRKQADYEDYVTTTELSKNAGMSLKYTQFVISTLNNL